MIETSVIVERSASESVSSNLDVVGRYVLTPHIFEHIRDLKPGAGGKLQLTDTIQSLLSAKQVLAYHYKGVRYNRDGKLGYLKTTVESTLKRKRVADESRAYLVAHD